MIETTLKKGAAVIALSLALQAGLPPKSAHADILFDATDSGTYTKVILGSLAGIGMVVLGVAVTIPYNLQKERAERKKQLEADVAEHERVVGEVKAGLADNQKSLVEITDNEDKLTQGMEVLKLLESLPKSATVMEAARSL